MKVYIKQGLPNFKEKKLIKELQEAIAKKIEENPNYKFTPARTYDELKELHQFVTAETVEFEEVSNNTKKSASEDVESDTQRKVETDFDDDANDDVHETTDPLNRQEPIVRDYVLEDEFKDEGKQTTNNTHSTFEEPKSFSDSFNIPDNDKDKKDGQRNQGNPFGNNGQTTKAKSSDNNDSNSGAKGKKRNKRFAKYIVEAVCFLADKGLIWYATKDITEAKLLEYQLNGEISAGVLQLLVSLDNGQQATVKTFFANQCVKAESLFKIDKDDKDDLIEAFEEFMEEKNFKPTATQNLMTVGISVFGKSLVECLKMSAENNAILVQLRDINNNTEDYSNEQSHQEQATATAQEQETTKTDLSVSDANVIEETKE